MRPKEIIPVNSPVGESESNGRGDNTVRRKQGKTKVSRHQLEQNMKQRLFETSLAMAWLVRWAAELLSKYSCGDDGRASHGRLHGEKCTTTLVPFGESVTYFPMKTVRRDKGDPATQPGVWLGIMARAQEVLIGIKHGVIKCRIVTRLAEQERWDVEQVTVVRGTPWEAVPGRNDRRVLVAIDHRGNGVQPMDDEDDAQEQSQPHGETEEALVQFRGGPDKFHVSKRAVERYGPTEWCPAGTSIIKKGLVSGRAGANHNDICRQRITTAMGNDPQYRQLMQKHKKDDIVANVGNPKVKVEEQRGQLRKSVHKMKQKTREEVNTITKQFNQTMLQTLIAETDVAEFYSPPRIASMASKMRLRAGWSLDITTDDVDGKPWDFNDQEMRNRAVRKVLQDKPWFSIGSPLCITHSTMNQINHSRMPT